MRLPYAGSPSSFGVPQLTIVQVCPPVIFATRDYTIQPRRKNLRNTLWTVMRSALLSVADAKAVKMQMGNFRRSICGFSYVSTLTVPLAAAAAPTTGMPRTMVSFPESISWRA